MKSAPLLLVTALVLALGGCGGDPAAKPSGPTTSLLPAVPVGTVEGRLLAVGGPEANDQRPLAGKLEIRGTGGSVLHAEIGADGRFAIQLAPGDYRLTATSGVHDDGKAKCGTEPAVTTLVADQTMQADVLCQVR